MSTFAFPTDGDSEQLGANMTEFVGRAIAIQPLADSTVSIKTVHGSSPALRVQVVDLATGVLTSPHLLYWTSVQKQVLGSRADWTIGTIEHRPQQGDSSKTVYILRPEVDMGFEAIGASIAKAESVGMFTTASDAAENTAEDAGEPPF